MRIEPQLVFQGRDPSPSPIRLADVGKQADEAKVQEIEQEQNDEQGGERTSSQPP